MLKINSTQLITLALLTRLCATAQSPATIVFPNPTPNPLNAAVDSYTRATTKINLQDGFKYGFVSGGASNLLNLNISTNPSYVSAGYLGSATNPLTNICSNGLLIDISKPVAETAGNFAVSASGAAIYEIPIVVSPGTRGIQPDLRIKYSSQQGLGILGIGWDLSGISSIDRVSKMPMLDGSYKGVELSTNDVFSLNGNRLFALTGGYGQSGTTYYTENENFESITSSNTVGSGPEKFVVKDKSGNTYKYGNAFNSDLFGQNSLTRLSWYLNEVTDEFGNYMQYFYKQLSGEVVIDKIEYTGNSAAGIIAYNSVKFEYMPLAENTSYYVNGIIFQKTQLLRSITSLAGNQIVRKYVFDYNWNIGTYLAMVREVDSDGNELNPTSFCWGNQNDNNGLDNSQSAVVFSNASDYVNLTSVPADLNGDGFSDYVCFNTPGGRVRVLHNEFKNNVTNNTITFSSQYDQVLLDHISKHLSSNVIDENKDNRQEVYSMFSDTYGYLNSSGAAISKSYYILRTTEDANGVINTTNIGNVTLPNSYEVNFSPSQFFTDVSDYTGDGISDYVIIDSEQILLMNYTTNSVFTFPLSTSSVARPISFNNDGVKDFIIFNNSNAQTMDVGVVTFNGSALSQNFWTSYGFWSNLTPNKLLKNFGIGDFNGDGIDDMVYLTETLDEMYIRRGDGFGFAAVPVKVNEFTPLSQNLDTSLRVEDIDGDGKADIIITDNSVQLANSAVNNCFTYFSLGDRIIKGFSYSGDWSHTAVNDVFYGKIRTDTEGGTYAFQRQISTEAITGNNIRGADFNGDGIFDLTSFGAAGQEFVITNNIGGKIKRAINKIETPFQKKILIDYANVNSEIYVKYSTKHQVYNKQSTTNYTNPLYNYKPSMYCVRATREDAGIGGAFTKRMRYEYSDAVYDSI